MEAKKVALACCIGGALCTAVALWMVPQFAWLGLFAGFAGGYLGYGFRATLRAIPAAFRSASGPALNLTRGAWQEFSLWSKKPHPFFVYSLFIAAATATFLWLKILPKDLGEASMIPITAVVFSVAFFAIMRDLAELGAENEKRIMQEDQGSHLRAGERTDNGMLVTTITYWNAARWIMKGAGACLWALTQLLFWRLPVFLLITLLPRLILLPFRFAFHLVRLVHSRQRLLCAVDGTLGGAVVFLTLGHDATTIEAKVALILFGGLLGAALGVLNYEIISKRVLKIVPLTQ